MLLSDDGAAETVLTSIESSQTDAAIALREFNFNVVDVLVNFEDRSATIFDVLSPDRKQRYSLGDFVSALRRTL